MSKVSVHHWVALMESGELLTNTIRVLNHIKNNSHTDIFEMRNKLELPHQTLTSRISNLMDEGLIDISGKRNHKDLEYSTFFYVVGAENQKAAKEKRLKEKYILWLEKGYKEYIPFMSTSLAMSFIFEHSLNNNK
jgi:predicted transcriptional regulator